MPATSSGLMIAGISPARNNEDLPEPLMP